MAWFRAGGAGISSSLKSAMNSVLNKKFGTSTTYPPSDWPADVNLLGPLPEKTASGAIASFSDGADDVPISDCKFYFNPKQAQGTPTPSSPLPITGWSGIELGHDSKYGGFVDFNQLASLNDSDWGKEKATFSTNGNNMVFTPTTSTGIKYIYFSLITGHCYMFFSNEVDATSSSASLFYGIWKGTTQNVYQVRKSIAYETTETLSAIWKGFRFIF